MPKLSGDIDSRSQAQPIISIVNRIVITLAYALVASFLISLTIQSFQIGLQTGVRGFAAAALPPIIVAYLSYSSRNRRSQTQLPPINLYFLSTVWIVLLLTVIHVITLRFTQGIPIGEFITSVTLTAMIFLYGRVPFRSRLSFSYGVLSGFLIYLLLFGLPTQ
jgi:predicted cobalt transporter CbtA